MEPVQNGESSRSPSTYTAHIKPEPSSYPNQSLTSGNEVPKPNGKGKARLILPQWDVPPQKHLHSSLDLISLLHLDGLYNTYVRPFADPIGDSGDGHAGGDGEGGSDDDDMAGGPKGKPRGKKKKRARLQKGYTELLEDCIDPTPLGEKAKVPHLLPLIPDYLHPPQPPLGLAEDEILVQPAEYFAAARLEVGLKQEGYGGKEKAGVREAEEKRKARAARHSASLAPDPHVPNISSPGLELPQTPLAPVAPPQRPRMSFSGPGSTGPGRGAPGGFRGGPPRGQPYRGGFGAGRGRGGPPPRGGYGGGNRGGPPGMGYGPPPVAGQGGPRPPKRPSDGSGPPGAKRFRDDRGSGAPLPAR